MRLNSTLIEENSKANALDPVTFSTGIERIHNSGSGATRIDGSSSVTERINSTDSSTERIDGSSSRINSSDSGTVRIDSTDSGTEQIDSTDSGAERIDSTDSGTERIDNTDSGTEQIDYALSVQLPTGTNLGQALSQPSFVSSKPEKLRPAEIAYLSSNGDISHTLLVLGADLVQRALKAKLSTSDVPPLAPYEVRMWELAKESVAGWAQNKAQKHLPTDIKKDPIEYARRVSKIYNFVVHTARHFVIRLLQDPREIRRYFKVSAIARLITDFSTAGYKAAFEEEFKNNMRSRGLIVPFMRKQAFAKHYRKAAVASTVVLSAVVAIFIHPLPLAMGLVGMCLLSAIVLRLALVLLHSIPYYAEIAEVIGHIKRQSWRLQALRLLIKLITIAMYGIVFAGFLALSGIALAILTFGFHHSHITFLCLYVFLTLAYILPAQIYLDGWRLNLEERPTYIGRKLLSEVRHDLAGKSPLDSFKEVLQTPDYVPTFSELLALYGIETLLILA